MRSTGSHSDPGCRARGPHTDFMAQQCRAQGSKLGTRGAVAWSTGPQSDLGCSSAECRVYTLTQGVGGRTQGPRPDPKCSGSGAQGPHSDTEHSRTGCTVHKGTQGMECRVHTEPQVAAGRAHARTWGTTSQSKAVQSTGLHSEGGCSSAVRRSLHPDPRCGRSFPACRHKLARHTRTSCSSTRCPQTRSSRELQGSPLEEQGLQPGTWSCVGHTRSLCSERW